MSFLPKSAILSLGSTIFGVNHFDERHLNQASYDMRLGADYFLVGSTSPRSLTEGEP